jgi:eukaryotic-like serine/threonine-protein kinase
VALASGTRLGPYEVIAQLGAGGMGEVYKARDTRLDRAVAIKVLREQLADDPDRRSRFEREARAIARLNHPHICTLHDVGRDRDTDYLVIEYLEGQTLADRLSKGPLSLDQAVRLSIEIADALDAAHRAGIIHRDLKPGNIMLTDKGAVLLDFGLAKASERLGVAASLSALATSPANGTIQGTILGTLQYMAPEQLEGHEVDARADVFAFGAVLYEMLTGRKAFDGKSQASVISAIMGADPAPVSAVQPLARPLFDHIIGRCLAKAPVDRWQSAGDVRRELEWASVASSEAFAVPKTVRRSRRDAAILAIAILTVVSSVALGRLWNQAPAFTPELRFELATPPTSDPISLAISPDGRQVVFVAASGGRPQLWLRSLGQSAAMPLPSTEGGYYPFWAPDSRSVGFFADGKLARIEIDGGTVRTIADAPNPLGGSWSTDGTILFTPNYAGAIFRVSASGGEPTPLTRVEKQQASHRFPRMLPDGRHFLYYATGGDSARGVYVGHIDGSSTQRVLESDTAADFDVSGHLFFVRQGKLFAQAFDPRRLALDGHEFPIADQVVFDSGSSVAALSVSHVGSLVYRAGVAGSQAQLIWFDRSGREVRRVGDPDSSTPGIPMVARDGRRALLVRSTAGNQDIWMVDLARGLLSRVTFDAASEAAAIWSPDGSRIVFNSDRSGVFDLYERPTSSGAREALLLATSFNKGPTDWSSDGRFILYRSPAPATGFDLWALPLFGDRKPFPVVQTRFDERDAQFSPDGKWIAYQSNESGRFEIYIQPFPGPGAKLQVSTGGGAQVRWRRDGKELFYVGLDQRLMSVSIRFDANTHSVELSAPAPLFVTHMGGAIQPGAPLQQYDVSTDGQQFLINTITDQALLPISMLVNWKPRPNQ